MLIRFAIVVLITSALLISACRNGRSANDNGRAAAPEAAPLTAPPVESPRPAAPPQPIVIDADDPSRWVFAEQLAPNTDGGFVTGSFDPKRNKIEIQTKDVRQFAVDTSRIPINWEKLVVIGIDGRNAELKRRDEDILHFRRESTGHWVVIEP